MVNLDIKKLDIKLKLYNQCVEYIENRIQTIQKVMQEAQESANNETKSSAGDKYETTRSMMQMDKAMNAKQLAEAMKMKNDLLKINPHPSYTTVQTGSLVHTSQGYFFIGMSVGKIVIEGITYFAISPDSPMALKLHHLQVNDEITFNHQTLKILEVM
jgi:transcription elongation GreA/GreB family factor